MLQTIATLIFDAMMLIIAIYSLVSVYVLLRFGKSKILGICVSIFYLVIMTSLYAAAAANFGLLTFPAI